MSIRSAISAGRRLMATSFVDTARIADHVRTSDGRGGSTTVWVARAEVLPCRFSKLNDAEQTIVAQQPSGSAWGTVVFPVDTPVKEGDRIVQTDGTEWTVFGETTPPGNAAVATRLLIKEV